MSIRIVMTPLFGVEADGFALDAALGLARRFEAHAVALFVHPEAQDAMPLIGEGMSRTVMDDLIHAAEQEIDRRREGAKARFEAARTAAGIALADAPPGPGAASAQWREVAGRGEQAIPREARLADLVVFGRGGGEPQQQGLDATRRAAFEATLLGGGRPLLLAPPTPPERIGHNVAVAWNGSAESARALAGAMPFLERAVAVHLLAAETWRTRADATLAAAEYLEWHGVPCERRPVEVAGGESVAAALLRAAGEAGADLLVMGGYGRTRLSELVLGGVTRHVLANARLPVLMAH